MDGRQQIKEMLETYYFKFYMPYSKEANEQKAAKLLKKYGKKMSEEEIFAKFKLSPFASPDCFKPFCKKYYSYFENVYDKLKGDKTFNGKGYILSVLADGFKYPQQLSSNDCFQRYYQNRSEFEKEEESEELKLAKRVVSTFTFLNGRTIEEVLSNPARKKDFEINYDNNNLDYTVYSFSSAFQKFAEKEGFIIDFIEEQSKIKKYPKLLNKIKEKLGADYNE